MFCYVAVPAFATAIHCTYFIMCDLLKLCVCVTLSTFERFATTTTTARVSMLCCLCVRVYQSVVRSRLDLDLSICEQYNTTLQHDIINLHLHWEHYDMREERKCNAITDWTTSDSFDLEKGMFASKKLFGEHHACATTNNGKHTETETPQLHLVITARRAASIVIINRLYEQSNAILWYLKFI